MQSATQSYGEHLPDQVDLIGNSFDAHLGLIGDIRELYRERAAIEREYSAKLQILAKKAAEKKAKNAAIVVFGSSPTKTFDESALHQSTLDNAYSQIIESISSSAQDHVNLSSSLASHVIEPLRSIEHRNEDIKKKQIQFYQKLVGDRDRLYADRIKSKQKYDDDCLEVEAHRQKQSHVQNDKHADRAARQFEQQQVDMLSSKNAYLIATAVANQAKAKFYTKDLPILQDSFQDLQTRLITAFIAVLVQAQSLQMAHEDTVKARLVSVETALKEVDPKKDQNLYIDFNIRPFTVPNDWVFEPCSSHYDTDEMSLDPAPKVYLQNKLTKSRTKLRELEPVLQSKRSEVDNLANLLSTDHADATYTLENVNALLDTKNQTVFYETSECVLHSEIEIISAALGDDVGGQNPHTFKSSSFSIPTSCGYCKSSIWGLSKQGKTCKACGLSVHAKCELKVPAECSGIPGDHKISEVVSRTSSTISRSESRTAVSSKVGEIPTPSSFVQPDTPRQVEDAHPLARVIFDFAASSPFELHVSEGTLVHVLEEDDGSGWVKVADDFGGKGLVPASYIETVEENGLQRSRSSDINPRQNSEKRVRVLYDYEAQGPDELTITEGDLIELSSGINGGQDYAEGWWEGFSVSGHKGIFPSNYVELI
ncbi:hypothetical protein BJ138DRAFT_1058030 [Hygrophoropsis aurantiaca]|uniref:Uncharacterized protein n=1 Tax=Hygrophoropsis aurantiaca TaxID=72124 RepID=A0ACB8AKS9_9AGAM|nr:hypothetical protein BJ138DRAFT_1058030 [Hygrophoropsis aurantiaca]